MRNFFPPLVLFAATLLTTLPDASATLIVVPLNSGSDWKFVEVVLPQTSSVGGISHHGVHDPAAGTIKWGPLAPPLRAVYFEFRDATANASAAIVSSPSDAVPTATVDLPVDADGDGIPATEEARLGLSDSDPNDARDDLDGDGIDNLSEYLAGTSIDDAGSRPGIGSTRYDEATGTLILEISGGRTDIVNVESASRLDAEDWITLPHVEIDEARPHEIRIDLSLEGFEHRFFRLRWGIPRIGAP